MLVSARVTQASLVLAASGTVLTPAQQLAQHNTHSPAAAPPRLPAVSDSPALLSCAQPARLYPSPQREIQQHC